MESAGVYSFGVVCPSVHPSARPSEFRFQTSSLNNWLEFNETLLESSISRGDAQIVGFFWSDT
jgi:hypothetical protein